MKKIINQKRYDTDSARFIGSCKRGSSHDPEFVAETLYRKQTGEYFLHGTGGPGSKYAEQIGNNRWEGAEKLIPLSFESAKAWAESHLSAGEYEAAFGAVDEEAGNIRVAVSLSRDAARLLRQEASRSGRTQGDILTELLRKKFKA